MILTIYRYKKENFLTTEYTEYTEYTEQQPKKIFNHEKH
jgi:hypothetical protein